jgi:peptide/nickel transport system ATP-binding protein
MTKIKQQFFNDKDKITNIINLVGLEKDILEQFPSQLSGGQLQRIIIAMVLAKKPKLLLLDEPTTALDTKSKNLILDLLITLQKELNFLMLFVTHDIKSIENICQDIAILKDGHIIEDGKTKDIIANPKEKYTIQLINSSFSNRNFRI